MVQFDCMQTMIAGYAASPKGQEAIRNYLTSPEGKKTIDRYLSTREGQEMAKLLLLRSLDGLQLSAEIKQSVRAALDADKKTVC